MMERGLEIAHTTIMRRVKWVYLYRAVDREGQTVGFHLSIWAMSARPKRSFEGPPKPRDRHRRPSH
jgi:hypothetical protein